MKKVFSFLHNTMAKEIQNMKDKQLCKIVREGKKDAQLAFEELYNRYSNRVYTYCYSLLEDSNLANDVFQDAFTKFYQSIVANKKIDNIASYITIIARNLCLNEKARKANNMLPLYEDQAIFVPEEIIEDNEMKTALDRALKLLTDSDREVIIMHEFLELNYKEMADIIGIAGSTLRTRVFRAREKLREILIPLLQDFENDENEIK